MMLKLDYMKKENQILEKNIENMEIELLKIKAQKKLLKTPITPGMTPDGSTPFGK